MHSLGFHVFNKKKKLSGLNPMEKDMYTLNSETYSCLHILHKVSENWFIIGYSPDSYYVRRPLRSVRYVTKNSMPVKFPISEGAKTIWKKIESISQCL